MLASFTKRIGFAVAENWIRKASPCFVNVTRFIRRNEITRIKLQPLENLDIGFVLLTISCTDLLQFDLETGEPKLLSNLRPVIFTRSNFEPGFRWQFHDYRTVVPKETCRSSEQTEDAGYP